MLGFLFHNARFSVVAASPDDDAGETLVPEDYDFDESIEGKILNEIYDLCSYDSDKPWPQENAEPSSRLRKQLADLAADACLSAMQRLVPTPVPEAQTLQDFLYPPTYTLQIFTDGDRLACRTLHDYAGISERHPPISAERLRAMDLDLETTDLRVIQPSQVVLVRRLQNHVWKVTADGEELICKASLDLFEHAIGDELATYLKIRAAAANGVKLRVPELKGTLLDT